MNLSMKPTPSVADCLLQGRCLTWACPGQGERQAQAQPSPDEDADGACAGEAWVAQVRQALVLLDRAGVGKVWEQDLDAVMALALGVESSDDSPTGCLARRWQAVKEQCRRPDGLIGLAPLLRAWDDGDIAPWAPWDQGPALALFAATAAKPAALGPFPGVLQYVTTFARFDSDRNGVVCARDLKCMLGRIVPEREYSSQQCRELIARVDSNFDGVVNLNEFGSLMGLLLELIEDL